MRNPRAEFRDLLKEKEKLYNRISKVSEYGNVIPTKLSKQLKVIQSKINEYYILTIIFFIIYSFFIYTFILLIYPKIDSYKSMLIVYGIIIAPILIFILYIFLGKTINDISNGFISLLKILLVILIIACIALFLHWIFEPVKGVMIQPFEISNLGSNISGTSVADLLSAELKDIADTNNRMQNKNELDNIDYYDIEVPSLHSKSIESSLANIGSVGYGGSSLSLGQLALSLKRLLKTQPLTIKGSVHGYGSTVCIVANREDSNSSSTEIWKVNRSLAKLNESPDEAIPYIVKDLAHQIALDLSKNLNESEGKLPQTWQAFESVNEGQREYLDYYDTGNVSYLYSAEENALSALNFEPKYEIVRSLYYLIGDGYLKDRDYARAEKVFKNMEEKFKSYDAVMKLGSVYIDKKEYQNASDAFNRTLRLKPDSYVAWYLKGDSLYEQGLYEKAYLAYDRALYYNSSYSRAWNKKGKILIRTGNYTEAIRAFSNAISNGTYDKELGAYWYNNGSALYCSNESDQANRSFNKSIDLSYFQAWNYIGLKLYNDHHNLQAIRAYDYYLSNNSGNETNNAIVWFNKGMACYSEGMFQMAVDSFDEATWIFNITEDTLKKYKAVNPACKCLNTDPLKTWADAWKYKGDAFYKLKKYDQAIKAYNKTIELDENNTEAMKGRELVLEVLNNKTSSINIISMNSSQS